MKYFNRFNCQGVSESCEVARGPKDPPLSNRVNWLMFKVKQLNFAVLESDVVYPMIMHLQRNQCSMPDHASLGESSGIYENLILESSLIKQDICQQSTDD